MVVICGLLDNKGVTRCSGEVIVSNLAGCKRNECPRHSEKGYTKILHYTIDLEQHCTDNDTANIGINLSAVIKMKFVS